MTVKDHCKKKISAFASILNMIDVINIHTSPYSKRYLQHLLDHRLYYLAIYADVLDTALAKTNKPLNELNLLDFGSGNGLLGMFAKHCGFEKVFLCDLNENFVAASRLTAEVLQIKIDGFITGELTEAKDQLQHNNIDIIAGTDVIEHVYDLDVFFAEIKNMNPFMITVFTTASNPDNYFKVRKLKNMQMKDELVGGDPEDFALAGEEKHAAYLDIRKQIIKRNFPDLEYDELTKLAQYSRGLRREDIIKLVRSYLAGNKMPPALPGDTNTCHPETGSWSERILPVDHYRQLYHRYGFALNIRNGFYNNFDGGLKATFNIFMNLLVKILGKKTAPFITLTGFPPE